MQIERTSIEGFARAPDGNVGDGDFLRHLKADGWRIDVDEPRSEEDEIELERQLRFAEVRWLDMEAANRREKAALRERIGLLPEDIDPDLGFGPPRKYSLEEWQADVEAARRIAEEIAPTVDHRPTVILFDKHGNERLITEPLPENERWLPHHVYYDKGKLANWQCWMWDYEEAVAKAAAASKAASDARIADEKTKKAPKKAKLDKDGNIVPLPDSVVAKIQAPKKRRQRVKERLREFKQSTAHISSDRRRLPFTESFVATALRSRLGICGLALFNSRLPKDAKVGSDKRAVFVGSEYMEQIFVRDMDYITIDWYKVRGQLVVELDDNFPGLKTLRRELMRLLGPALMPTLIVYSKGPNGEIERPHLLWILPPRSEVGICGKSKGAPIRTFNMVQKAIINALIEIGADPDHENLAKFKNPLTPNWHVACEENFPDLTDFIKHLPTCSVHKREMKRRQAARKGVPENETGSQRDFRISKEIILRARARARRANDRAYKNSLATPELHAKWLKNNVSNAIIQALGDTKETRKLLGQQIAYWSGKRPSAKTRTYDGDNRFRDRDLQQRLGLTGAVNHAVRKANGIEKKRVAAIETNRGHREKSLAILDEQIGLFQRIGGDIDDKTRLVAWVRKSGKLGKSTVYNLIDVAVSLFRAASRYIAQPSSPAKPRSLPASYVHPVTVPSVPVAQVTTIVSVPSAPATPASPVDPPTIHRQQPAAPASSEKTCRLRPAEPQAAGVHDPTSDATSSSFVHGDHHTLQ